MDALDITAGVRQEPVRRPLYGGILRLQLPAGCDVVAFADDVVLVVVAKRREVEEKGTNEAITRAMALRFWS